MASLNENFLIIAAVLAVATVVGVIHFFGSNFELEDIGICILGLPFVMFAYWIGLWILVAIYKLTLLPRDIYYEILEAKSKKERKDLT